MEFFRDLYSMDYLVNGLLPYHSKFPIILMVDMDSLLLTTSDEEIYRAVFSMAPLKTPGVDGFHQIFRGAPLDPKMNRTLHVLLPKVQGLERITQFRPISLCTVVYKIVTKKVVNRQKPLMVKFKKPNQASFVFRRNINHNIIVAQEAIHSMKGLNMK
ncbi:hypothetical protein J1N35_025555 [Gossypium stocksii]|uniref:Reverse transcriptase domain-containing protein n=1 Tax=Gossypium stocksii TaxID=47602 RepID=A0A9D3V6K7_9ROSI|nr:hypothetical protein J1N35_025555 [Gossypium stocksii]